MKTRTQKTTLVCLHDIRSSVAEAYRTMGTNIQFSGICHELKSLMVTSASPCEGKTTTIANLAVAFAQAGKKVVVLDGDFRKPALHRIFDLENKTGLGNLLIDGGSFKTVVRHIPGIALDIITAGDAVPSQAVPSQAELLSSPRIHELMRQLKSSYDLVLIDSPPVLAVSDAQLMGGCVDGVLVVVRSGKVAGEDLKRAKGLLDLAGARVIGTVLNRKKVNKKGYYDYYR